MFFTYRVLSFGQFILHICDFIGFLNPKIIRLYCDKKTVSKRTVEIRGKSHTIWLSLTQNPVWQFTKKLFYLNFFYCTSRLAETVSSTQFYKLNRQDRYTDKICIKEIMKRVKIICYKFQHKTVTGPYSQTGVVYKINQVTEYDNALKV